MRIALALLSNVSTEMADNYMNYVELLRQHSHNVVTITRHSFAHNQRLKKLAHESYYLDPKGYLDVGCWYRAYQLLQHINPKMIIAHGNKSIDIMRKSSVGKIPVLAVNYNHNIKRSLGVSGLIAINNGVFHSAIEAGQQHEQTFLIPPMLHDIKPVTATPFHHIPVIGMDSNHINEEGMSRFIYALGVLKGLKVAFQVVIYGKNYHVDTINSLIQIHQLEKIISFASTTDGYHAFLSSIDLLCVSSCRESYNPIFETAAIHAIPVVTTPTDAASQLIHNEKTGLISSNTSPDSLAKCLYKALKYPKNMQDCANDLHQLITKEYSAQSIGEKIEQTLHQINPNYQNNSCSALTSYV